MTVKTHFNEIKKAPLNTLMIKEWIIGGKLWDGPYSLRWDDRIVRIQCVLSREAITLIMDEMKSIIVSRISLELPVFDFPISLLFTNQIPVCSFG